mmetsp:Transcript_11289/g.18137  ORF Transcript_11289/g.18137 Transcript_11289/m.18137 type:complete len:136 (-) Transcript_11289:97-504(-)
MKCEGRKRREDTAEHAGQTQSYHLAEMKTVVDERYFILVWQPTRFGHRADCSYWLSVSICFHLSYFRLSSCCSATLPPSSGFGGENTTLFAFAFEFALPSPSSPSSSSSVAGFSKAPMPNFEDKIRLKMLSLMSG